MKRFFAAVGWVLAVAAAGAGGVAWAAETEGTGPLAARMQAAARALEDAVPEGRRAELRQAFTEEARTGWKFTPGTRRGVALGELEAGSRDAVWRLVQTALSAAGRQKAEGVIELEAVLRELQGRWRDPGRYWITLFGEPGAGGPWGWRFEGHHLSLNVTVTGADVVVDTPMFFGANPADRAVAATGGRALLGAEMEQAWQLLDALAPEQRAAAVVSARTYGDIVTGERAQVDPFAEAGLAATAMNDTQRQRLLELVETWAGWAAPELAAARLARVREGGLETMRFVWAGGTERGRAHYWRVQGATFVIEWDNSQNDGNHVHTVWRDFARDFGRDLLREHHHEHRH